MNCQRSTTLHVGHHVMVTAEFIKRLDEPRLVLTRGSAVRFVSPGLTSSEQQARTQSRSDRTARASMAVVGLFKASLTLTITLWCCLEKHVSGSTADTGSVVISIISTAATGGLSVHEGRLDAGRVMAAADRQSVITKASESTAGEQRSRTYCRTDTSYLQLCEVMASSLASKGLFTQTFTRCQSTHESPGETSELLVLTVFYVPGRFGCLNYTMLYIYNISEVSSCDTNNNERHEIFSNSFRPSNTVSSYIWSVFY